MLGLVGYGSSDSEGEGESNVASQTVAAPPPVVSRPMTVAKPSTQIKKKKKKAKVLVSFLPPEIQAALARGDTTMDSDEELDEKDEERRRKIREQVARANENEQKGKGGSQLFKLLPKPKAEAEADALIAKNAAPRPEVAKVVQAPTKPSPPPDEKESDEDEQEEEEEEEEEGGEGILHPSLLSSAPTQPTPSINLFNPSLISQAALRPRTIPGSSGIVAAPSVSQPLEDNSINSIHSLGGEEGGVQVPLGAYGAGTTTTSEAYYASQEYGTGATTTAADAAQYYQQGYVDPNTGYYYDPSQYGYGYAGQEQQQAYGVVEDVQEEDEFLTPEQRKKKKERDIRRALNAGDLSVLSEMKDKIKVIATPDLSYNPFKYGPPKEAQQIKIASTMYDVKTGETKVVYDASKTHKKKHHINSLALQAAEMELDILDSRGRGNMTKAQTQAKYGW